MRILALLFVVSALGFAHVTSADNEIPYIYYHSEALNAIVIERADGTDSRAIARDLMPVNHDFVSGPGWSPSGEWLAWTSAYRTEYSAGPQRIWVMSPDGGQRLAFLDAIENVFYASWSPTGDYLLLIEYYRDNAMPVWLIDVAQQRTIATFDDIVIEFGIDTRFWSADGKTIQIGSPTVRVVYVDGRIEDDVPAEMREPLVPPSEPERFDPTTAISPDGNHEIVLDGDRITRQIHDLNTDERVTLRPYSGGAGGICGFDWNPGGNWLFVTFNTAWANGGCGPGGTSIVSADGRIQRELGPCNIYYDNCANWLPERVIEHLSPGEPTSVVPDPILALEHNGWVRGVAWHPDGVHLATYSDGPSKINPYSYERTLTVWDTNADPPQIIRTYPVDICADGLFLDCKIIWSGSQTQIGLTSLTGTQIVDALTGEIMATSDAYLVGFEEADSPIWVENATAIDYEPAEQLIARADWRTHSLEIFSREDGKVIYEMVVEKEAYPFIDSVTFVPNTAYIALIHNPDEPVQGNFLWDPISDEMETLPKYGLEYLTQVKAFDSETIIGYGRASLLYFWDVESRTVAARLNRYVISVDVTSDLSRMATGSGYMVEVWDYQTIIEQLSGG